MEIPPGGRPEPALTDADGLADLPGYELDTGWTLTESGLSSASPSIRIRLTGPSRPYAALSGA